MKPEKITIKTRIGLTGLGIWVTEYFVLTNKGLPENTMEFTHCWNASQKNLLEEISETMRLSYDLEGDAKNALDTIESLIKEKLKKLNE